MNAWGDYFILALIGLEAGAAATYLLLDRDWRQAVVWLGVAVSNAAWLAVRRG